MEKLILLHSNDNILIARASVVAGERYMLGEKLLVFEKEIGLGHKIARHDIKKGETIIKYGVPIGSATEDIAAGNHIHLHNMKSDYIPTYTLEKEFKHGNR